MPFILVPTIAKEKYIKLCHEVYEAKTKDSFMVKTVKAAAYSDAIKDICGIDVWGEIVMEADRSFSQVVDTCAGIPLTFNPSTI